MNSDNEDEVGPMQEETYTYQDLCCLTYVSFAEHRSPHSFCTQNTPHFHRNSKFYQKYSRFEIELRPHQGIFTIPTDKTVKPTLRVLIGQRQNPFFFTTPYVDVSRGLVRNINIKAAWITRVSLIPKDEDGELGMLWAPVGCGGWLPYNIFYLMQEVMVSNHGIRLFIH